MKDQTSIEIPQSLTKQWEQNFRTYKETIKSVLAAVNDMVSDWLVVIDDGQVGTFVYLGPGSYECGSDVFNGCRQKMDIAYPGVYKVDSRHFHEGHIVLDTEFSKPVKFLFLYPMLMAIVKYLEKAVKKEIEITTSAIEAENLLAKVMKLI